MGNEQNPQNWHGPFYDAMQLELKDESGLIFRNNVTLNTGPIALDLLIVKKNNSSVIKNEIGQIFRGHNIFEYKSPGAQLGIDTFFKVIGYASLYKADTGGENEIDSDDITISFVREGFPFKLMHWFEGKGFTLSRSAPGVYQVVGAPLFVTQIIVIRELSKDAHLWLRALTRNIDLKSAENLVREAQKLKGNVSLKYTDSILYLIYNELNKRKKMEDDIMFEKTMSLFQDQIDAYVKNAVDEIVDEKIAEITLEKDNQLALKNKRIAELEEELAILKNA